MRAKLLGRLYGGEISRGKWSPQEKTLLINCLEMLAVHKAILHFLLLLRDQVILVRSDNTAVVQFLKKQGGTLSIYVHADLGYMAIGEKRMHLVAHIAGKLNVLPDQLSRIQIWTTE